MDGNDDGDSDLMESENDKKTTPVTI